MTQRQRTAYIQAAYAELVRRSAAKDRSPFVVDLQDYQKPPPGDWRIRLFRAGRAAGKTFTGSAWAGDKAENQYPGRTGMIVGPTYGVLKDIMVEGEGSGLLDVLGDRVADYKKSAPMQITTTSGSTILCRSADSPDTIRGPNAWWCWADEIVAWKDPDAWHKGVLFATRSGPMPQIMATTTPARTSLIRDLMEKVRSGNPSIVEQTASMFDNAHISEFVRQELLEDYEGTEIGRQELYGEYIDAIDGAIWREAWIQNTDYASVEAVGGLAECAMAVDPSAQLEGKGDECGIVVGGRTRAGDGLVIADETISGSPGEWAEQIVTVFHRKYTPAGWTPKVVVIEGDGHGALAQELVARLDERIPTQVVFTKSISKEDRARPISTLWEQGKVFHLEYPGDTGEDQHGGRLDLLEDQMISWVPGEVRGYSPDRVDALVWLMKKLFPERGKRPGSGQRHNTALAGRR